MHLMVLILDGNSEIGSHVRSNLCCLICLRHLIRSRTLTNRIFFSQKITICFHACATCYELPSNISNMATSKVLCIKPLHLLPLRPEIAREVHICIFSPYILYKMDTYDMPQYLHILYRDYIYPFCLGKTISKGCWPVIGLYYTRYPAGDQSQYPTEYQI